MLFKRGLSTHIGSRRGLSLLETVIALFLFTAAAIVTLALFHSSLQRTTVIQQGATARLIATRVVGEMRAQMAGANYGLSKPEDFVRGYQDPDHPGFRVDVLAEWASLESPSIQMGKELPVDSRKVLDRSAIKADVRVTWNDGREKFQLLTLLEEPFTDLETLTITGLTNPLTANAKRDYQAKGVNSQGRTVDDLVFLWWVEPVTGNGTVTARHSDGNGVLFNQTRRSDGIPMVAPGVINLKAIANYRGQEVIGKLESIQLSPP